MTDDTLADYHDALTDFVDAALALEDAWMTVFMAPPAGFVCAIATEQPLRSN